MTQELRICNTLYIEGTESGDCGGLYGIPINIEGRAYTYITEVGSTSLLFDKTIRPM